MAENEYVQINLSNGEKIIPSLTYLDANVDDLYGRLQAEWMTENEVVVMVAGADNAHTTIGSAHIVTMRLGKLHKQI